MLRIEVDLLHGTIRAGSPDEIALTGEPDPGEWPPSPARLVSAFVAADGTGSRCRVTDGSELGLLEKAGAPVILADPPALVCASKQRERFVVENKNEVGRVQEYLGRKPAPPVRPSTRLAPRHPRVTYVWEDAQPTKVELAMLSRRANRIGYLGCADSPVRVTVGTGSAPDARELPRWSPDPAGRHSLPVPFEGLVEVLDRAFDEWSRLGRPVRRSWYRVERTRYRSPEDPDEPPIAPVWGDCFWLRFESSLPGRSALSVTESLKAAVLDLYQRYRLQDGEVMPSLLHGHGFESRSYQVTQWLALPEVGHDHATGRLHGAAVMLPADAPSEVVAGVRQVLHALRELAVPGREPVRVRLHGGEARPQASQPWRWKRASRRWVSVLPVIHEQWRRRGPSLQDIGDWCAHAGFPRPTSARLARVSMIEGGLRLEPSEVFRDRPGARHPYSHLAVEFPQPVRGPVVLGRARQFGLGLMLPIGEFE